MAYPRRLLTEDEEVVREFHPHWRVLLGAIVALVAGAAIAIAAMAWTAIDAPWNWIVVGLALVVAVAYALPRFVAWRFRLYVLTSERIIVRDGVVSRNSTEIPLENINNVLFTQSVTERLLGHGDVLIESAGSQGQSRLTDIPDPEAFQSEVYRVREMRSVHLRGDGDSGPRDAVARLDALADLHDRGVLTDEEFAEKKQRLLDEM